MALLSKKIVKIVQSHFYVVAAFVTFYSILSSNFELGTLETKIFRQYFEGSGHSFGRFGIGIKHVCVEKVLVATEARGPI